jgi:hypothetical protein
VKKKRNKGRGELKNVAPPSHFYRNSNKDKINAAIKAHDELVEMNQ